MTSFPDADGLPGSASAEHLPVRVDHVVKDFRSVRALDGVSFSVHAGETFGVIGPNGSGMTTLMRLLLGLSRPTSGTVQVLGHAMPTHRVSGQTGYMTQSSALYNELTARESLAFFGRLYGLRGTRLRRGIDDLLALVDLADRAGSLAYTLSGGMRQRLSLACALIHQPRLLFLDEPTVGIDPELRHAFWGHFGRLNQRGVTILVSTHYLDEAARCHRTALLRFGKLLAVDTPAALRRRAGEDDFEQAFLSFARRRETANTPAEVEGGGTC